MNIEKSVWASVERNIYKSTDRVYELVYQHPIWSICLDVKRDVDDIGVKQSIRGYLKEYIKEIISE